MSSDDFFVPIPPSQLGGAIAVNVFALLSTLGLVSVALRIIWIGMQHYHRKATTKPQEYVFFHTQLGQYATCLLAAMIFITAAGLLGLPWLIDQGITEGSLCRTQAFVMQVGSWSAGYFTVAIAAHTFNSLGLKKRQSPLLCRLIIVLGWILAFFTAGAPFLINEPEGYVYGADGLSCGVRSVYRRLQFFFHLFPILVASILSVVLYSLVFLILRGTLTLRGGVKLTLDPNKRWSNETDVNEYYHKFMGRVAKSMLWYPAAYIALLVPYSIMRLLDISGFVIGFEASIFAFVCWYALGIVNVLLLYNTFRVLGPAFDGNQAGMSEKAMSYGNRGIDGGYPDEKSRPLEYQSPTWSTRASVAQGLPNPFISHSRQRSDDSIQPMLGQPIIPGSSDPRTTSPFSLTTASSASDYGKAPQQVASPRPVYSPASSRSNSLSSLSRGGSYRSYSPPGRTVAMNVSRPVQSTAGDESSPTYPSPTYARPFPPPGSARSATSPTHRTSPSGNYF